MKTNEFQSYCSYASVWEEGSNKEGFGQYGIGRNLHLVAIFILLCLIYHAKGFEQS